MEVAVQLQSKEFSANNGCEICKVWVLLGGGHNVPYLKSNPGSTVK